MRVAHCRRCSAGFALEPDEKGNAASVCPACDEAGGLEEALEWRYSGDLAEVAHNLRRVSRAGSGLLALINDLLDFSKLEAGKMELELGEARLSQVIGDVVDMLEPIAAKAGVTVVVDSTAGDATIDADQVKLGQVLINLVGNAIKFSKPGGKVTLRCRVTGPECHMSVHDEGIGIAAEHHATIFESFRQVDGSSTRRFGGTGLGLAISKKYVELHGGTISLESELGRGSIFHVKLPLRQERMNLQKEPAPASPGSAAGVNVVIVDDEPFAIENLKGLLQPLGCQVVGVRDPRELDAVLSEVEAHVLFVDVVMPRVSGLEVLRELRARPKVPPIVITSAHPGNAEIARNLGAEWLEKPWRKPAVQSLVLRLSKASKRLSIVEVSA
jgi:CheY-like chemotaxis protein